MSTPGRNGRDGRSSSNVDLIMSSTEGTNPLLSSSRLVGQVKWFSFRGSVNFQLFPPLDMVIQIVVINLFICISITFDASSRNERSEVLVSTPWRLIGETLGQFWNSNLRRFSDFYSPHH